MAVPVGMAPLPGYAATPTFNLGTLNGAATAANQVVPTAAGTGGANAASIQGIAGGLAVPVSGTFWQTTQPVSISSNVPVYLNAVSSGGAPMGTTSWLNTAATVLSQFAKASAGMIYGYSVSNGTAAAVYFRIYNQTTAPTAGVGTPVFRVLVPAGQTVTFASDIGLAFATGIAFTVTTGSMADSDTGTITAANTVAVNIAFK